MVSKGSLGKKLIILFSKKVIHYIKAVKTFKVSQNISISTKILTLVIF